MRFKNKREIYQALLEGKVIRLSSSSKLAHLSYWQRVYLNDKGELIGTNNRPINPSFNTPSDWEVVDDAKEIAKDIDDICNSLSSLRSHLIELKSKL